MQVLSDTCEDAMAGHEACGVWAGGQSSHYASNLCAARLNCAASSLPTDYQKQQRPRRWWKGTQLLRQLRLAVSSVHMPRHGAPLDILGGGLITLPHGYSFCSNVKAAILRSADSLGPCIDR